MLQTTPRKEEWRVALFTDNAEPSCCWTRRRLRNQSSDRTGGICTRRAGKLHRARSRLYRRRFLQVNTRWKALAKIYTTHSFAPFWNPQSKLGKETGKKRTWSKQPRKSENERPLSSSSLPSTSAEGGCEEKLTRMKIEYAYDIWSPFF